MRDLEDRIIGLLLGLAAGDQIGGPVRMALRVAESLRDRGGFDVSDIGARYLEWWRSGAFDTGPTAGLVLSLVASGVPFEQASVQVDEKHEGWTAGCNPVHRNTPLAMRASLDDSHVGQAAAEEARLTHRHPLAGDVAAAAAVLCRTLIRGMPWPTALSLAADGRLPGTRDAFKIRPPEKLSPDGFAPNVLGAALCFINASDSFSVALARSIDFAGPSNYCPVLVGSIGGARWGRSQIDEKLLHHHGKLLPRLEAVALFLAREWQDVGPRRNDG